MSHTFQSRGRRVEALTSGGAATHLHFLPDDLVVWLDTDIGIQDGLCIGVGATRRDTILDAIRELRDRLVGLERALGEDGR